MRLAPDPAATNSNATRSATSDGRTNEIVRFAPDRSASTVSILPGMTVYVYPPSEGQSASMQITHTCNDGSRPGSEAVQKSCIIKGRPLEVIFDELKAALGK